MNKYAFEQGFLAVCHKYGVNPSALVKFAQYIAPVLGDEYPRLPSETGEVYPNIDPETGGVWPKDLRDPQYTPPKSTTPPVNVDFSHLGWGNTPTTHSMTPSVGNTHGTSSFTVDPRVAVHMGNGKYLPQITLHETYADEPESKPTGVTNTASGTTPSAADQTATPSTATPAKPPKSFSYVLPTKDPKTGKWVVPDNGNEIVGDPSSIDTTYTGGTRSYTKDPEISQDGVALQWKQPQTPVHTAPNYTQPPPSARSLRPNVPDSVGPPVENPFYTTTDPRYIQPRYAQPRYSYTPPATPTRQAGQVTYYKPRKLGRATFKGRTRLGY